MISKIVKFTTVCIVGLLVSTSFLVACSNKNGSSSNSGSDQNSVINLNNLNTSNFQKYSHVPENFFVRDDIIYTKSYNWTYFFSKVGDHFTLTAPVDDRLSKSIYFSQNGSRFVSLFTHDVSKDENIVDSKYVFYVYDFENNSAKEVTLNDSDKNITIKPHHVLGNKLYYSTHYVNDDLISIDSFKMCSIDIDSFEIKELGSITFSPTTSCDYGVIVRSDESFAYTATEIDEYNDVQTMKIFVYNNGETSLVAEGTDFFLSEYDDNGVFYNIRKIGYNDDNSQFKSVDELHNWKPDKTTKLLADLKNDNYSKLVFFDNYYLIVNETYYENSVIVRNFDKTIADTIISVKSWPLSEDISEMQFGKIKFIDGQLINVHWSKHRATLESEIIDTVTFIK